MLTGESPEREILPRSMWQGLVRQSRGARSWSTVQKRALERGFTSSGSGLWLPDMLSSWEDLHALRREVAQQSVRGRSRLSPETVDRDGDILGSVAIGKAGCWVASSSTPWSSELLQDVFELDNAHSTVEASSEYENRRQCDVDGCLYPRHYDLTPNTPAGYRKAISPNGAFYQEDERGVLTAWGNRLPSVSVSRELLRQFQGSCMPYVPQSASLLTLSGISQIALLPRTGCWMVNSYYMRPTGGENGETQYDAYGRLAIPSGIVEKFGPDEAVTTLAHKVVWLVLSGRPITRGDDINHLCGFRPCTNPGHLKQVSHEVNVHHGGLMAIAKEMVSGRKPVARGLREMQPLLARQGIDASEPDLYWQRRQAA